MFWKKKRLPVFQISDIWPCGVSCCFSFSDIRYLTLWCLLLLPFFRYQISDPGVYCSRSTATSACGWPVCPARSSPSTSSRTAPRWPWNRPGGWRPTSSSPTLASPMNSSTPVETRYPYKLVTEHGHLYWFNVVKLDNHSFQNFYEDKSFINEYLILTFWTNYCVDLISWNLRG